MPLVRLTQNYDEVKAFLDGIKPGSVSSDENANIRSELATRHLQVHGYISHLLKDGQIPLASQYQRTVKYYSTPRGETAEYLQKLSEGTFHTLKKPKKSFTFNTEHHTSRAVGYILSLIVAGMVTYIGYKVFDVGRTIVNKYEVSLEEILNE